jgi:hypothetical protein
MPTPTWYSWRGLVAGANVPATPGDRVEVDQTWVEEGGAGYDAFVADVGERPPGTSLVRIDSSAPFTKSNCRWGR